MTPRPTLSGTQSSGDGGIASGSGPVPKSRELRADAPSSPEAHHAWDTPAHRERYRKVLMREMTLDEAIAEATEEHRHALTELDAAFLLMRGHRPAGRERWVRMEEESPSRREWLDIIDGRGRGDAA